MSELKSIIATYLVKQPMEFIVLLVLLGSVVYLAKEGKETILPYVINIGAGAVLVVLITNAARWVATTFVETQRVMPEIRDMLCRAADSTTNVVNIQTQIRDGIQQVASGQDAMLVYFESQAESSRLLTSALSANIARRTVVLLVEDAEIHQKLIARLTQQILKKYNVELDIASSLREAWPKVHRSLVILLDVTLQETSVEEAQQFCSTVSSYCPIILYTGGEYTEADFPSVRKIHTKRDDPTEVITTLEETLRSQLMKG